MIVLLELRSQTEGQSGRVAGWAARGTPIIPRKPGQKQCLIRLMTRSKISANGNSLTRAASIGESAHFLQLTQEVAIEIFTEGRFEFLQASCWGVGRERLFRRKHLQVCDIFLRPVFEQVIVQSPGLGIGRK